MKDRSEIHAIDFHVGDHLVQACGECLQIFPMGNTSKEGIILLNDDLRRILAVAQEQVEGA